MEATSVAAQAGGARPAVRRPDRRGAEESLFGAVTRLAESCGYEAGHTQQVTRLALRLFDALKPLHHLRAEERFWLRCGATLHDIGWVEGQGKHHKTALRIILNTPLLPFTSRERLIIGSIARYHRKALPSARHDHFAALKPPERRVVARLAAILRVADGLDRSHQSVVQDLTVTLLPTQVHIQCAVSGPAEDEREAALEKGRLLEEVFERRLTIECHRV